MKPAPQRPRAPSPRALVFDLGNVLIEIDFMRCVRYWSHRAHVPAARIIARFRTDRHYEAFERGHLPADIYFSRLRRQLGINLGGDEMAAGWNRIIRDERPGIRECILRLKPHFPLYVLTNTNAVHAVEWGRRHQGLLRHFKRVFVSSDMGCRKPEAAAYHKVQAGIGVPAGQVIFLDDTRENIAGAEAAGLRAVHVQRSEDIFQLAQTLLGDH